MTTQRSLLAKRLITHGVAASVTLALGMPVMAQPQQCDTIFAVNDANLNVSQILTMGDSAAGIQPIGVEYPGYDMEAMDIDKGNVLYTASGDDTANQGFLYKVNKRTGELTVMGPLCVREADGISFNLVDNTLWGWGQDQGVFQVLRGADGELDLSTCQIVLPGTGEIEDVSWDNEGKILYGVGNVAVGDPDKGFDSTKARRIVAFTPATGNIQLICEDTIAAVTPEIEGIEMQPDGTLMLSYHDEDKLSAAATIDPVSCALTKTDIPNPTHFKDIEALACCLNPLGWIYQKDYVGDGSGSTALDIYGIAVKIEDGVMTVAMNANMGPDASQAYFINSAADQHISFSDLILDFSGKKYAAKFTEANNSGVTERGLYEAITLKDVTQENRGYVSFQSYASHLNNSAEHMPLTGMGVDAISTLTSPVPIMGALTLKNDYFSWTASRSAPMSISTGTRVADDGFTMLSEAQLAGMGLDFKGAGITVDKKNSRGQVIGVNGSYTFGFSFKMPAGMTGDFLAYFFTECLNDGVVIKIPLC